MKTVVLLLPRLCVPGPATLRPKAATGRGLWPVALCLCVFGWLMFGATASLLQAQAVQGASGQPAATTGGAPGGLIVNFTVAENPLEFQKDANGVYAITGLPFPGEVLYRPADSTMFYLHPEEAQWLTVPPNLVPGGLPTLLPRAGPAWTPFLDQPTRRWDLQAQPAASVDAPDPTSLVRPSACPAAFTSAHAAQLSGLNLEHLQRIVVTLQWLNSGLPLDQIEPCDVFMPTPTQAQTIGLPVVFTNLVGRWQLSGMNAAEVPPHQLPALGNAPVPDAETRLRLLLVQLAPPEREEFIKAHGQLPLAQQIDLLARQLTSESMP